MKSTLIKIAIFSCLLFVTALPLYAQGKSAQAPGQTKKEEKKMIVGSVDQVTTNSVVIEESKNKKKTEAVIEPSTKVVGKDKKPLKLGTIKLKDLIAVISSGSGTATGSGKPKVKKIFVKEASESAQMKRRAVMGVITEISGGVLTLAHQIQRDRTYKVTVTADTIIKIKSSTATASASLTEVTGSGSLASLAVGQRIAAVGDLAPDGGIVAKRIHVITGKATGIFKRLPVATPSASLVASPSAPATNQPGQVPVSSASAGPTL